MIDFFPSVKSNPSLSSSSSSSSSPNEIIDQTIIPNIEDRTIFLTCLALILSNYCYEYDYMKIEEQQQIDSNKLSDHLILKQQHRCRRHLVACNLLEKCTEYLGLPQYQAQRWLPILHNILIPISEEKRKKNPLSSQTATTSSSSTTNDNEEGKKDNIVEKLLKQQERFSWKICRNKLLQENDFLKSEFEKMTPEAGYRCLCLVLFQYLLQSEKGYDARVRVAFKRLAVTMFVHNAKCSQVVKTDDDDDDDLYAKNVSWATRKFESLEQTIADRILGLAQKEQKQSSTNNNAINNANSSTPFPWQKKKQEEQNDKKDDIESIVRIIKIGTAGVVAGTLLVVTGGMAAPAIAGGLGLIGLGVLGTHLLAASTVIITLFGTAGGGLAMYKMNRRTAGLTEFIFQPSTTTKVKKAARNSDDNNNSKNQSINKKQQQQQQHVAELARTICISGWLRDHFDFQRPWGVTPNFFGKDKKKKNHYYLLELLERFYAIHDPDLVPSSRMILNENDWNKDNKLWTLLGEKYGVNPDHVFPLNYGPRIEAELNSNEEEVLDNIFNIAIMNNNNDEEIILDNDDAEKNKKKKSNFWDYMLKKENAKIKNIDEPTTSSSARNSFMKKIRQKVTAAKPEEQQQLEEELSIKEKQQQKNHLEFEEESSIAQTSQCSSKNDTLSLSSSSSSFPAHLSTVWDYHANYGGELYTVQWESGMLLELCRSVLDLALDMVSKAGQEVLRQTVASPLIFAAALPSAVISGLNSIDEPWNLAIERSDAAGKELARILLSNCAGGRRPVTLVGYSFGARIIFSCLKELAKYQVKWEEKYKKQKVAAAEKSLNTNNKDGNKPDYDGKKKEKIKHPSPSEFDDVEPACIVEDAILMGMPKYLGSHKSWEICRSIVSGRLVNVFSRNDKILSLLFKYKRLLKGGLLNRAVCGNCPIKVGGIAGVENFDVSDIVANHTDYCLVVGEILERIRHGQPLRYYYSPSIDDDDINEEEETHTRKFAQYNIEDDELILGWASE